MPTTTAQQLIAYHNELTAAGLDPHTIDALIRDAGHQLVTRDGLHVRTTESVDVPTYADPHAVINGCSTPDGQDTDADRCAQATEDDQAADAIRQAALTVLQNLVPGQTVTEVMLRYPAQYGEHGTWMTFGPIMPIEDIVDAVLSRTQTPKDDSPRPSRVIRIDLAPTAEQLADVCRQLFKKH